jgi:segregation and condensation protein A
MLLPRPPEEADDDDDPRAELVRQLLEYRQYKEAATLLEAQAERQQSRFARTAGDSPSPGDLSTQPVQAVELWDLVSAFGRLMRETLALQPQQIIVDETPIHVYQERVRDLLARKPRLSFVEVFTPPRHRARLVGILLALLELIKMGQVTAHQDEAFGDIWLSRAET